MKYFIIILLFSLSVNAQHHANNWFFSAYIGYKFSTQDTFHTPLPYNGMVECLSTISTESGELLFSCDGTALYQGTAFDTVLNGEGLLGNKSMTNGSVILTMDDFYLVIIRAAFGVRFNIVRYSESLNNWNINDIEKNIRFIKNNYVTEQVAAIKHGNGRDWWVIARSNTHIYVSLFDVNGYVNTDSIAHDFECLWSIGEISVSAQGNKVAMVDYLGKLSLLDFDRCGGIVSNISDYNIGFTNCNTQVKTYGCCFSPNGRYLYISNQDTLFQFDVTVPDVLASKKIVHTHNSITTQRVFAQMERAPNGDIYLSYTGISGGTPPDFLSRIKKPDEVAPVCDFEIVAINIYHNIATGLPNMPDFYLGPLAGSPCDTLTSSTLEIKSKSMVKVYPNPAMDVLNIEMLNNLKLNSLTLLTVSGTELMSLTPTRSLTQLNLRNIPPGFYLLRIVHADGTVQVRKVVKQ
ncbi:hypothetical protein LBMAG25_11670 [Bacteroidota bacterium]|nr:hypothetical protein LBMAG25_11670 [Bacteroidota bacterium]